MTISDPMGSIRILKKANCPTLSGRIQLPAVINVKYSVVSDLLRLIAIRLYKHAVGTQLKSLRSS